MIDGQNILQLAKPLNTSRTDKDCTVLLQLMQPQTKKKEEPFWLNQFLV